MKLFRSLEASAPETIDSLVPQVEVGYTHSFAWGKLIVSQAARFAYGFMPLDEETAGNYEQAETLPLPEGVLKMPPLSIWVLAPHENAQYTEESAAGEPVPIEAQTTLFVDEKQILLVAGLAETQYGATKRRVAEMGTYFGVAPKQVDDKLTLLTPKGNVSLEEEIERRAQADLLAEIGVRIGVSAAYHYQERAKSGLARAFAALSTGIGVAGVAVAGVETLPQLIYQGYVESTQALEAGGTVLTAVALVGALHKAHTKYRESIEYAYAQEAQLFGERIRIDIVEVHKQPDTIPGL